MDLCSKIIHSFWNCQVCLKNKGISSLYAMKRCSAGEGINAVYQNFAKYKIMPPLLKVIVALLLYDVVVVLSLGIFPRASFKGAQGAV